MYDIVIRNATVIDGTDVPAYSADVAIRGDRIAAIGSLETAETEKVIDGSGKVVTPGFIDVHSHGDATIMMFPGAQSHTMQGITTFIGGLCGDSVAPLNDTKYFRNFWEYDRWHLLDRHLYSANLLQNVDEAKTMLAREFGADITWHSFADYLNYLDQNPTSINFVPFVGHSQLRVFAMGEIDTPRAPTAEERKVLREETEKAMAAGAWGLSTGLDYSPSKYADDGEIDELIGVIRKYGGIYSSHWRTSFQNDDPYEKYCKTEGLRQACETALRNGVKMEVSHLSSVYQVYPFGNDTLEREAARETLKLFDHYVERGADLVFNAPPNTTYGFKCIPYLAMHFAPLVKICGGAERFAQMLSYPEFYDDVKRQVCQGRDGMFAASSTGGWSHRMFVTRSDISGLCGLSIAQIAAQLKLGTLDTVLTLIQKDPRINVRQEYYTFAELETGFVNKTRHPNLKIVASVII